LVVEDKNIIIGDVATPSDITADGGGITLKGDTDKTLNWIDATDAWTSSEDFNLVSGKSYEINGTVVVNSTSLGTGITGSSLTSVGTLTTLAAGNTTITGFANVVVPAGSGFSVTRNSSQYILLTTNAASHSVTFNSSFSNSKVANFNISTSGNTTADLLYSFAIDGVQELKVNSSVTAVNNNLTVVSNTATFGTALYVVANGNVGINTASPAQLLDVNGNAIIRGIQGFNATNETATLFLGDGASYIQAVYDGGLDFYQNSTFRMRIQGGTGRVGIANNAPANMLRVEGDASIATTLAAGNTTITGTVNVSDTVTIRGFTGGTLTSAVSGYAKTLVIGGIYNQPYNTANAVLVHIADYSNDTGDNVYPIYVEDENNFVDFFLYAGNNTAGTDKRAYFGGSVGIGNTTPTAKLQVDGAIKDSIGNVRTIQRTGTAKTSSYTLTTSDVGQFVEVGAGGSIVVPNSTFATGDVVSVFNNTSGNVTVTLNTTNAYIGGVDANRTSVTLATRGIITILFLSGTLCIINGNVS